MGTGDIEKLPGKPLKDLGLFCVISGMFLIFGIGTDVTNFLGCCMIPIGAIMGIIGISQSGVMGFAQSNQNLFNKADGGMVLKQKNDGTWGWENSDGLQQTAAKIHNNEANQILGRVIKEVRDGKPLEDLASNEISVLAKTYGVGSGGTDLQKISGLKSSDLASKALKLGAVVGGTAAVLGGAGIAADAASQLREAAVMKAKDEAIIRAKDATKSISAAKDEVKAAAENIAKAVDDKIDNFDSSVEEVFNEIDEVITSVSDPKLENFFSIVGDHLRTEENYRMAFNMLDLDGDGSISVDEIGIFLPTIGAGLVTKDQIQQMISGADKNNDGTISYEEFVVALKEQIELTEEEPEEEAVIQEEEEPEEEAVIQEEEELVLTSDIDTELERIILDLENSRLYSERKEIINSQHGSYAVMVKIEKMERTLIGSVEYKGGQTITGLIDGGPYSGLVKIPPSLDEEIMNHREGDTISVNASLVDFSPSLKRPVLEASVIF
ncbi:MAG: EF-hand domain-containing protein [Candidatus Poseidoniaceae archaeon]|nr:EF-hand domain-containing protein [Candidatus Poseidoniaceae archaeon]